ncbi:MAG: magnesium/cobalt transporter CorA [Verrucomicrobiaceae bacterium]|nr:MAG: magnesium/cobalt transporter CorA [Verrucomicrobiaceae bacterium]
MRPMSLPASGKTPGARSRMRRHHRDHRPPAQTPGEGGHVGEQRMPEIEIRVFDYTQDDLRERDVADGAQCLAFEGSDSPAWIRVTGLHDTSRIHGLLETYHIHPLVQDDVLNTNQSPKVEDFGDYLFITVKLLALRGDDPENRIDLQHIAIILTPRVLITFQEAPSAVFDPVVNRLRQGKGLLRRQGPDYLAWALLDALLDHYLVVLDGLEEDVSRLDEALTLTNAPVDLHQIHHLRVRTTFIYRTIRPIREVAVALQHTESELLSEKLTPFLRDLYDHAWHAIESAEHLREAVSGIREYHQAVLSQRMNEIMKVLAAISTIFLPLSFLAGVYGMNFEHMPELKVPWAYPAVWCVFLTVGLGMYWYFRRRRWL